MPGSPGQIGEGAAARVILSRPGVADSDDGESENGGGGTTVLLDAHGRRLASTVRKWDADVPQADTSMIDQADRIEFKPLIMNNFHRSATRGTPAA
jgi:hypothetical protein